MEVNGIDHVEFYVGDATLTAFHLRQALQFRLVGRGGPETGLKDQRSLVLQNGDIRILLTTGLTPEHPASVFVARHGDGVAVVALATDDATAAYEEVVARQGGAVAAPTRFGDPGRPTLVATVSGFGDVVHRFVQRPNGSDDFLPARIQPTGEAAPAVERLRVIDHVAVCVPAGDLEPTVRYYQDVLGFSEIFDEYIDVGGQGMTSKVVQSADRSVTFTIIEPDPSRRPGQIDDFLSWHDGPGVQHLAFLADDIVATVDAFAEGGLEFAETSPRYYRSLRERGAEPVIPVEELERANVLVDSDRWGQLFQIFTRSVQIRQTFFFELIERHGAQTFGSGNVKALYEAKERELAEDAGAR
jgi:4-hydroxymandelate synthase